MENRRSAPRIRADLRAKSTTEQIELVRRGLWKVVNEDGGTGGRARLDNVVVAGKTGTAQATDRWPQGYHCVVLRVSRHSIIPNTSSP